MDITRWSIPKSDWLHSLQPKMEKFYRVSKNKTGSCLWLRSWTSYCQIQKGVYPSLYVGEAVRSGRGGALSDPPHPVGPGQPRASPYLSISGAWRPRCSWNFNAVGQGHCTQAPTPCRVAQRIRYPANVVRFWKDETFSERRVVFIIYYQKQTEGLKEGDRRHWLFKTLFLLCYQMRLNTPIWSNSLLR